MNYQVHFRGENLGVFPLPELLKRRQAGTLTGQELVWCEGMANWQNLDSVLGISASVPLPPPRQRLSGWIIAGIVAAVLLIAGGSIAYLYIARSFMKQVAAMAPVLGGAPSTSAATSSAADFASRPIAWQTNSLTREDVTKQEIAFGLREFADAYDKYGPHGVSWSDDANRFVRPWIQSAFGQQGTNVAALRDLADGLAKNPNCNDPVVLLLAATASPDYFGAMHRFQRGFDALANSKYPAYLKFYAAVHGASYVRDQPQRAHFLDRLALEFFRQALRDGSLRPEDQPLMADRLLTGWASGFFGKNEMPLVKIAEDAGPQFRWLSLVIKGDEEKDEAWRARGGGWANTVTAGGWQQFSAHLARAHTSLEEAWNLHPEWPQAAAIMVTVEMGEAGGADARQWFDRATIAQLDYSPAWHNMRWTLRPRWDGSLESMRAFGVAAIDSGRFDTDVPRQFFDTVTDLEAEEGTPAGTFIYGRSDIWPQIQRMYNGYIQETARTGTDRGWRGAYAIAAYLAGHYDVAREQLEKLNWQVSPSQLEGWSADLSLFPLEVAARTSSHARAVAQAEDARNDNRPDESLGLYQHLSGETNDERTSRFIQYRLASLQVEQQLNAGQWVSFLPTNTNDLNWNALRGQWRLSPTGGVEIQSGPEGGLLLSRVRVGSDFELQGDFDVVSSSTHDFQAGIVMGLPELQYFNWYAFRMKRNTNEDEVASLSQGWNSGLTKPCLLDSKHNSFDIQLRNGKTTAIVDGRPILSNAQRPASIWVAENQYLLGLGAYNDQNETVIRYHDVKVRRLSPELN